MKQEMRLEIESLPSNESFARVVVAAFVTRLNPTMEEVADIKTAISEAVTNAIIHGYQNEIHKIIIEASVEGDTFQVSVQDFGRGIEDISTVFLSLCIFEDPVFKELNMRFTGVITPTKLPISTKCTLINLPLLFPSFFVIFYRMSWCSG